MSPWGALYATLRARGLRNTAAILLSYAADYSFDWRYGTDTRTWASLDSLAISSANKAHGEMYQPTLALPLTQLWRSLPLPADSVLVDLGCGKGRVLLSAALAGLATARGVEFSPELCRIARRNCAEFAARTHVTTTFEVIEADVVDYAIRPDETVFFLYNPFDAAILRRVLHAIGQSCATHPRPVWIIYRNAVHRSVIDEAPGFVRMRDFVFWGLDFAVFLRAGILQGGSFAEPQDDRWNAEPQDDALGPVAAATQGGHDAESPEGRAA